MKQGAEFLKVIALLMCFGTSLVCAQSRSNVLTPVTDSRGPEELRICSQNLKNYGQYADSKLKEASLSQEDFKVKEDSLVQRFVSARCDVVAVQELLGKDEVEGKKALIQLAENLRRRTNRKFDVQTGPTNDRLLRVGYLVARDRATIINTVSYVKVELPKTTPKQKVRLFPRGPLEIQLEVKGQADSETRTVSLITFHFKSHAGAENDPTGLEWETYRMEMAEALRRIYETRYSKAVKKGKLILVMLGDRNSNFDVASARILEGELILKNFQANGGCRLSKRGVPLCQAGNDLPKKLFSVLTGDPQTRLRPGTFSYKGVYSWLDDILMPPESLPFASASEDVNGDYSSGIVYEPAAASDHALVWVGLNW